MARPNQTGPKQDRMEEYHWWSMYRLQREDKKKDAHLHITSLITTKFQEFLLSGFRRVALTIKIGQTSQKHYTLRYSLRGV